METLPPAYAHPIRTLVFTDLVGSLELRKKLGDDAAGALVERHRRLLRRLLGEEGGREIDNPGDGFFLVFDETASATRFALCLQRAQVAADLPPLRIGIHRGDVRVRRGTEGDSKPVLVEGLSVDLANRIQVLAHPGQILMSGAAFCDARGRVDIGEEIGWKLHGQFVFQGLEDLPVEVGECWLAKQRERPTPVGGERAIGYSISDLDLLAGRYRLEKELGRGNFSVVYAAQDERLDRPCAVKVLCSGRADAEQVERFKREAVLTAKLGDHEGVVGIYDAGAVAETGQLFLAMERIDGPSLEARLEQGALPREEGLRLVEQVSRAMAHAHDCGVIHRDVKPSNIIIASDGTARLTDFGVAKILGGLGTLTPTGHMVGTPSYMAPEQIVDSRSVGPAADIYGLGGLLYAVLTGSAPYTKRNWRATTIAVLRGELIPPAERLDDLDPRLDDLCRSALAVDPANRPASALEFADRLKALATGGE